MKKVIIFEDSRLIACNKPPSLVTMGARGEDSLFARLDIFCKNRGDKEPIFTAHRLDKESSGIVIFAKGHSNYKALTELFHQRKTHKEYVALVLGNAQEKLFSRDPEKGVRVLKEREGSSLEVTLPIFGLKSKSKISFEKGAPAYSKFVVEKVKESGALSLVKAVIKTGRMHQIRCHLSYLGVPIVGDPLYALNGEGASRLYTRLYLHSALLEFTLSGKRYSLKSAIPQEFLSLFEQC